MGLRATSNQETRAKSIRLEIPAPPALSSGWVVPELVRVDPAEAGAGEGHRRTFSTAPIVQAIECFFA